MQPIIPRLSLWITAAALAVPLLCAAQSGTSRLPGVNLNFERLSLEKGLSQTTVLSVIQDHRGFLWLGTQDGLNRYDGYGFEVYRHDPIDSTSLSESFVQVVYEDRERNLWAGTWGGGLNRFDRASGRFIRYRNDVGDASSLVNDIVLSIYQDSRGTLWVGTAGGLERYDPGTDDFTHVRHDADDPRSLSDDFVWSLAEDKHGSLWVGTYSGGLNRLESGDRDDLRFTHYRFDGDDASSLSDDANVTVFVDADGTVWVGTASGLDRYDSAADAFTHYRHDPTDATSLCDPLVQTLYEDRDGGLWVGTANGLCRFDRDRDQFTQFHHNPADPTSLAHNVVRSISEDESGILWIGTGGGGLGKYNRSTERFGHYRHDPSNSASLSNSFVWDFAEDGDGFVWIGTDGGGLSRFSPAEGTFWTMRHDPADPTSISDDVVLALATSSDGSIWAGTYSGGLNHVDVSTRTARRYAYTDDERGLSSPSVNALLPDENGDLWIGTWGGGLNHFDARTERFRHFQHDPGDARSLSNDLITCLLRDRNGTLWIGTNSGGLNRFDGTHFKRLLHQNNIPGSLSHNTVYDLFEDSEGRLWVATAGGLNRFDNETGRFDVLTTRDGLPHNIVYGIAEDAAGRLWLSTNAGLSRYDLETDVFESFRVSDGLQSNEFNAGAAFSSSDGDLYFGGINGFNRFRPEVIQRSSHVPPVVLTGFKRFDRDAAFETELAALKEINLQHDDNFITFEFAALDFVDPPHNRYAYMLEGVDAEWRYTDGQARSASYTKLEPGRYTFRLKGANSDGTWNEEGIAMAVNVIPPWWGTWWFRIFALSSIVTVMVLGGFRWHRSNLRKAEWRREEAIEVHRRLAEARESERIYMARELHDGAVQDIYGARIQLDALTPKLEGEDRRRIDGVQDTLHHVYSTLRDVSRELRPPILGSFGLAKAIRAHLTGTTKAHPHLSITHDLGDDGTVLPERVRLALYRIYQEGIRNILRHAGAENVHVSMHLSDEVLALTVRDDGRGFNVPERLLDLAADNHLGLIGANERAESIGGTLHVTSRTGEGTAIEVIVPIHLTS